MEFFNDEKENLPGPINLGNPSEISIKNLAEEIINLTGSKSKIVYQKLPTDDPKQRCPNIDIAKKELSWKPSFNRETGLKKTVEYFDALLKKEKIK